jgi:Cu(I)/Ag(I) efflux system membrane protein CusA/SilA
MSLGGIAVSDRALVDAAVVVVENAHKKLESGIDRPQGDYREVLIGAIQEVGRPSFFACWSSPSPSCRSSPGRQEGASSAARVTKTLAMAIAALLAITLDPAIAPLHALQRYEFRRAGSRAGQRRPRREMTRRRSTRSPASLSLYEPSRAVSSCATRRRPRRGARLVLATIPATGASARSSCRRLNEGSILYMPTTLPGMSVTAAQDLLQRQDRILRRSPRSSASSARRARGDLDRPGPFSMMETVVILKPEPEWRTMPRWYSSRRPVRQAAAAPAVAETISSDELVNEMNAR